VTHILILAIAFSLELTLLSLLVDGQALAGQSGAAHWLGVSGVPLLHFLVSTAAIGATFTYLKKRPALEAFSAEVSGVRPRASMLTLHAALYGVLLAIATRLYTMSAPGAVPIVSFLSLGCAVGISGLFLAGPPAAWARLIRSIGSVWVYAAGASVGAVLMTTGWRALWRPGAAVTYTLVRWMLQPLVGHLIVEPGRMRISTDRFGVIISPECSGLEGLGLLLLFGAVWLWLYRKECRFPQALLLLPAAMGILFVLNSVRIAALLLIGHAGAEQVAEHGFHSQAGWIAFNAVAFGLCVGVRRIPWIANVQVETEHRPRTINLTAVHLGPMLAIVAAGMLSRALTGGFEWLYPLRFVAACIVFWIYRAEYRSIGWRFTWRGPAIGLAVFALWMGMEWALGGWPAAPAPAALTAAPSALRWGWTLFRILGSVVAVPTAEELAFRGYLLRRLVAEDFDQVPPTRYTMWALAASSVLFGAMHGARWAAGTAAGALYAWAYVRKGQLGEAVVAHAVTNGLIAAAVLLLSCWKLW
jgi:exosortase E/protease (VPEID-CTERM system)